MAAQSWVRSASSRPLEWTSSATSREELSATPTTRMATPYRQPQPVNSVIAESTRRTRGRRGRRGAVPGWRGGGGRRRCGGGGSGRRRRSRGAPREAPTSPASAFAQLGFVGEESRVNLGTAETGAPPLAVESGKSPSAAARRGL